MADTPFNNAQAPPRLRRWTVFAAATIIVLASFGLWRIRARIAGGGGGGDEENRCGGDVAATTRRLHVLAFQARLSTGGKISGRITGENGQPVEGAMVCGFASSPGLSSTETREPRCGLAAAGGKYELANLLAARYAVSAAAPGHRPGRFHDGDRNYVEIAPEEDRGGIDVILRTGGVAVHGRVKDIGGGVVAGAMVQLQHDGAITLSDAKGEWTAWNDPGSIYATARARGYAQGHKSGTAPGLFIEILLTPESVLVGRAIDAKTREPIVDTLVIASPPPSNYSSDSTSGSAFSDAEGKFRIDALAPGRYDVTGDSRGRTGQARPSVLLGLGQTSSEVIVEMHAAVSVSGRVLLASGKPCADGWLRMKDYKRDLKEWAQTDRDGNVFIKSALPGIYKAEPGCDGALAEETYPEIVVAEKDIEGLVWKVREGRAIRGVVVDANGAGVAKITVSARPSGGDPRGRRTEEWKETRADGTFALQGLLPGAYNLRVFPDKDPQPRDPTNVTLEPDRDVEDLRIVLDRGGMIEGDVRDETGAAVPGINVRAMGASWVWGAGELTRDDGTFTLRGLKAGEYRVVAQRGWSNELRKPGTGDDDIQGARTTVIAGQTSHVHLTVESQSGEIKGQVVDEHGKAVTDAFVDGERESESAVAAAGSARRQMGWGWSREPVLTDLDGRFVLTKLSKGAYTVRAFRKGGGEAIAEHVLVGSSVTLSIANAGSLSGSVVTESGHWPERFTVSVSDKKIGLSRSETFFRSGGEWTVPDLPAGTYHVSASAAEGTGNHEAPLAEGEKRTGIRIVIRARSTLHGRVVALDGGKAVPGIRITARPTKGQDTTSDWDDSDRSNISDAQGNFTVQRVPVGKIFVDAFPVDWQGSEYSYARTVATTQAGQVTELPPLRMARRRIKPNERGGDLGFECKQNPPGTEPEQIRWEVAVVRADGPAAESGLKVGDVIVSVDTYSVTGADAYLYWSLAQVPEGTALVLGVQRGAKISITAQKPL